MITFFLIVKTGQIESPFIIYLLATLGLLYFLFRGLQYYLFSLVYVLACIKLPVGFVPRLELPYTVPFKVGLLALSFFSLTFVGNYLFKSFKFWYFHLLLINRSVAKLDSIFDLGVVTLRLEKLLQRVFQSRKVCICWFNDITENREWEKSLFINELLKKDFHKKEKRKEVLLTNHIGQQDLFYFFPINQLGKTNQGFILVEKSVHWYELIYLNISSNFLISQKKKIALKNEITNSLKEEVRKKLAQDLHDGVAQQLFFLSTKVFQLKQVTSFTESVQLNELINQMETQIQQSNREVREHIRFLMEGKENHNIFDAIENLINKRKQGTSLNVSFTKKGRVIEESLEINETLYRIAEEAINNILKHANAKNVNVVLEVTPIQWTLKIVDDGIGICETTEKKSSLGLNGMRERVKNVYGQVMLRSKQNQGTEVIAIIPRIGVEEIG
ncbi:sensor histidine kinase [Anaerobacillus alkaliphilus]|nr:ATP-binding protein [Anaerobacillus alkaliphilus]